MIDTRIQMETSHARPSSFKQDIAELNRILKVRAQFGLGDTQRIKDITKWYTESNKDAVSRSRNRLVDTLINLGPPGLEELRKEPLNALLQAESRPNKEISILLIRYHICSGELPLAMTLFRSLDREVTRTRHVQLLLHAHVEQGLWDVALELFSLIVSEYPIPGTSADDLVPFLTPRARSAGFDPSAVLDQVIGQPIQLPPDLGLDRFQIYDGEGADTELRLLDFTETQIEQLTDNINSVFLSKKAKVPKVDLTKDYDYIIDGANVLFYGERKITPHSYRRISRMLRKHQWPVPGQSKIMVVLHERHRNPWVRRGSAGQGRRQAPSWAVHQRESRALKDSAAREIAYWKSLKNVDICWTPRGVDDDHYSLLNAFPRPRAKLITNDKFRDHIAKLSSKEHNVDLIAQWRKEKVIEYEMDFREGPIHYTEPMLYSFRIQKIKGDYYLPIRGDHGSEGIEGIESEWYKISAASP